jgi:hypothetical protein
MDHGLESRCAVIRTVGSNPTLSVKTGRNTLKIKDSEKVSYKRSYNTHRSSGGLTPTSSREGVNRPRTLWALPLTGPVFSNCRQA